MMETEYWIIENYLDKYYDVRIQNEYFKMIYNIEDSCYIFGRHILKEIIKIFACNREYSVNVLKKWVLSKGLTISEWDWIFTPF